jgi:tetratricopeptide (TPR) repeat protein
MRIAALLLLSALPIRLAAQDAAEDPEVLKKRILEKVSQKLKAERRILLDKIEKLINEELAKTPDATPDETTKKLKELEKRLAKLDEEKKGVQAEIVETRRRAEDAKILKELEREPLDEQDLQGVFDEGMKLHGEEKDYDKAIPLFKKVFYTLPEESVGFTAAYNVACGYALKGDKERAIDWLEISIKYGFTKFDHIKTDSDLDSLRGEPRFRALIRKGGSD